MNRCIFIFLIFFSAVGCEPEANSDFKNVNHTFTVEDIGDRKFLKGSKVDLGLVLAPIHIFFNDSLLFIASNGLKQNISVYNVRAGFSNVGRILPTGMGPEELMSVLRMDFNEDGSFWVHDAITGRIKRITLINSNDSLMTTVSEETALRAPATTAFFLKPDQIVTTTQDIKPLNRFYIYNREGIRTQEVGSYPEYDRQIPATALVEVFSGWITVHPDREKFLLAYEYTDLIEIYNSSFALIKRIHGPHLFKPEFELKNRGSQQVMKRRFDKTKFAYQAIVSDENKIFLLYANGRTVSKEDGEEAYHYNVIIVLDWNGNPISHYTLDHPVTSICVDWGNRIIYGLDRIESEVYAFPF